MLGWELLTVTFREAGLVADALTTVAIAGEATADAACTQNDKVVFSLHSHSAVSDESEYRADENGRRTVPSCFNSRRGSSLSMRPTLRST